jgi:hypothetical protein
MTRFMAASSPKKDGFDERYWQKLLFTPTPTLSIAAP